VAPRESLTNTAEVESYSTAEGGSDFADPGELTDSSTVTITEPAVDKSLVDTSHDDAANTDGSGDVAVGEVVTYSVTLEIPEGELANARIQDSLPAGMAFVGLDSVTVSPGLTSDLGDLQNDVRAFYDAAARTMMLGLEGQAGGGFGHVLLSRDCSIRDRDSPTALRSP